MKTPPDKIYAMIVAGTLYADTKQHEVFNKPYAEYIRKDIVDDMLKTAEDHAYFAGKEKLREAILEMPDSEKSVIPISVTVLDDSLEPIEITAEEKQINQEELEKEINQYLEPIHTADIQFEPFTQMTKCARHFAQWGAEHAKNG